jgi:hypothetical protein
MLDGDVHYCVVKKYGKYCGDVYRYRFRYREIYIINIDDTLSGYFLLQEVIEGINKEGLHVHINNIYTHTHTHTHSQAHTHTYIYIYTCNKY